MSSSGVTSEPARPPGCHPAALGLAAARSLGKGWQGSPWAQEHFPLPALVSCAKLPAPLDLSACLTAFSKREDSAS